MEKKVTRSRLAGIPAWALSLMTLFASIGIIIILQTFQLFDYRTIEIVAIFIEAMFIVVACYYICRTHPTSFWYTPVICNAAGILVAIFYPYTNPEASILIFLGSVFVLSVIGSIVGARIGRRLLVRQNN
jgi:hypothetical protein